MSGDGTGSSTNPANPSTTDTEQKMSPLAVLVNPLNAAKEKLLLISCSNLKTLTIEHRTLAGKVGPILTTHEGDKATALLAYPSSLAAMVLEENLCVYGITGNEGDYKIALVSPVYQPATHITPKSTSLAGFANKAGTQGYLYFQSKNAADQAIIKEWVFDLSENTGNAADDLENVPSVLVGTKLAAATDEKKNRWVAYQQSDGRIAVYNAKTGKNYSIDSTTKASVAQKCGLALCVAPSDKTAGRAQPRLYVYFVDQQSRVRVATSAVSDNDDLSFAIDEPKPTFAARAGPSAHIKVREWSQLAAVPYAKRPDPDADEAGATKPCNLLFGVKQDGGNAIIQTECDEWAK